MMVCSGEVSCGGRSLCAGQDPFFVVNFSTLFSLGLFFLIFLFF